jgi:pilus assembly protein CpaB
MLAAMLCVLYRDHVYQQVDDARSEALERYGGEIVSLVVATEPLEPGDMVSQSNVTTRDWLVDLAPKGALTDMAEALGKEVSEPASEGAPLTDINFRTDEATADVPNGYVALTLPVTDKLGISRNASQGLRLEAYQVTEAGSSLIAGDIQVLSQPVSASSLTESQITVAVLPDEVAAVLAASATGDLRLVVPAEDVHSEVQTPTAPEELVDTEVEEAGDVA